MSSSSLFKSIPETLFSPLASPSRNFYADLLVYLFKDVFSIIGDTPNKKQVIFDIRQFIERRGADQGDFIDGGEGLVVDSGGRDAQDQRSYIAYNRLVNTGWLVEHHDSYRRLVDFDPIARMVLSFLIEISEGGARSYGGAVLNVLGALETAKNKPDDRSEALHNAARYSLTFMHHLRAISATMHKVEEQVLAQETLRDMFRGFFKEFVEQHLIEDYRRLHTQNNPFRFRNHILILCQEMVFDDALISRLADGYVREGRARDASHAKQIVREEIDTVMRVFETVDEALDVIDRTTQRIERRILNTVRFMDSFQSNIVQKTTDVLELLGKIPIAAAAPVDVKPTRLPVNMPVGPMHLFQSKARRPEIGRQRHKVIKPDPVLERLEREKRAFAAIVQPNAKAIQAYIESQLGARDTMNGSEMTVETLADFVAFERLRDLPFLFTGQFSRRYGVTMLDAVIDNEWIFCRDFVVRRITPAKGNRHA